MCAWNMQALKDEELDHDQLLDLTKTAILELRGEQDRFIRGFSVLPFCVTYFTDEQQEIHRIMRTRHLVLHLDATGGVIRNLPEDVAREKEMFLYALVVKHPTELESPLAVCEFLTNSHSASSIALALLSYRDA